MGRTAQGQVLGMVCWSPETNSHIPLKNSRWADPWQLAEVNGWVHWNKDWRVAGHGRTKFIQHLGEVQWKVCQSCNNFCSTQPADIIYCVGCCPCQCPPPLCLILKHGTQDFFQIHMAHGGGVSTVAFVDDTPNPPHCKVHILPLLVHIAPPPTDMEGYP